MRWIFFCLIFLSQLLFAKESLEKIGDAGQYIVPLSALTFSLLKNDNTGLYQFAIATGLTMGVTYGLKYSCNSTRPNGGPHSFPSGHSAISFAAAAYLDRRYGLTYAFPAYIASAFVGYTRVEAKAHRTADLFGAFAIAYLSNYLITTRWQCTPCCSEEGVALSMHRTF